MFLRRICLLLLGVAISTGICAGWVFALQNFIPAEKRYSERKCLPMFVEGTDLLAEQILSYEGEYIEDVEFGEFVFTTGLILRNTGDKGIICAKVKLIGEKDVLEFDATFIPPGKAVMVLEKNRKETASSQFYACTGIVEYDNNSWQDCAEMEIESLGNDRLRVTNTASETVSGIWLYYKTVYDQELFYIGGITHCYRICTLSAGESIIVSPTYFTDNSSQIVYITTGNSASH